MWNSRVSEKGRTPIFQEKGLPSVAEVVEQYLKCCLGASETKRAGTYNVLSQCCEKTAPVEWKAVRHCWVVSERSVIFCALSEGRSTWAQTGCFFVIFLVWAATL